MKITQDEISSLYAEYNEFKSKGYNLDMSRGKPCTEQLDLSEGLLKTAVTNSECYNLDGIDTRNYGMLDGLPEMKNLFAELLGVTPDMVIAGDSSSLKMMYDTVATMWIHGAYDGAKPWSQCGGISFICVVPGYDRHFAVTESFGINMINVPISSTGPDMDMIEELIKDETVKGIWCVPKYSNPDGITYSDETVRRFAALKPAAKDFRIMWDNAYAVHDFDRKDCDCLLNIFDEAKKNGTEDMIYMYCSTSKITYPGSGVAAMISGRNNVEYIKKRMFVQTIGPNKLNQLRHVRYFRNAEGIMVHMEKQAAVIQPRFDCVLKHLEKELTGLCTWHKPKGGYFISLYVPKGCAKRVVALMAEAGIKMTGAGASYPYKKDPDDSNIRIAPTYPSLADLDKAARMLCVCCKLAAAENCK